MEEREREKEGERGDREKDGSPVHTLTLTYTYTHTQTNPTHTPAALIGKSNQNDCKRERKELKFHVNIMRGMRSSGSGGCSRC
jgi:hypothetical protein